jgi:hypothetical protein
VAASLDAGNGRRSQIFPHRASKTFHDTGNHPRHATLAERRGLEPLQESDSVWTQEPSRAGALLPLWNRCANQNQTG